MTRTVYRVGNQNIFGRRLRHVLTVLKLSKRSLCREFQLDLPALRRLLRGERSPSWATAIKLADALGVSLDYFAGRVGSLPALFASLKGVVLDPELEQGG